MKNKLIFVIVLAVALAIGISSQSFKASVYKPRQSSFIEEISKSQIAGGKTAAGMAEYFNALRVNLSTGTVSSEEYLAAIEASVKLSNSAKRVVNSVWNELGPDNVGGRTRAFLQHKDSSNIMFVGSVSGGLFRSETRGGSWKPVNDYQENLNVNCIAQNSDGIIVYGTGEGEFVSVTGTSTGTPGFPGAGIFRSTDGGRSFTRVVSTFNFGTINSMASEKNQGTRIYASTSTGIKYSDDGLTWSNSRNGNSKEIKVATNGWVYAQSVSAIVRSKDRGATWEVITPTGASIARASIAISPTDPNYVYFMASGNDNRLSGVYKSVNGGDDFEQIIGAGTVYFDPLVSGFTSAQGYYNNVISVNPSDKNHIIMGGAALAEWKLGSNPRYIASLNDFGGANPAYVHADKHVLEWDMSTTPPTLICGNDGGLFFSSDNLKTFTMKNAGFNVTQFYAVAADYNGNVVGGSQDNGTQYINKKGNTEKAAVEIKGGDGFQVEISVKNPEIIFAETYYGNLTRSRDYGKSQSCAWDRRISKVFNSLSDTSKYCEHSHQSNWAPFNAKFRLWEHPEKDSTQSRLFLARHGQLWMANGITDFQAEPEWYLIATAQGPSQVWEIEPTEDGGSVFISNSNAIYRIDGLNTATYDRWSNPTAIPPGITITNIGFPVSGRSITSICLDPNDNNVALITLGNYGSNNYVYRGNNMLGSATFTNITNNLPPMPVYDGIIALSNPNLMFLGTDLGVYASDNGGSTWTAQTNPSNGFPKVPVLAIRQYKFPKKNSGSIYAGTHGRGFYECQQYFTSTEEISKKANQALKAYPNPASDFVNVELNIKKSESLTLTVYDLSGKKVMVQSYANLMPGTQTVKFESSQLEVGTYIVAVKGEYTNSYVKLIIRR